MPNSDKVRIIPLYNTKDTRSYPVTPVIPPKVNTGDVITSSHENQMVQAVTDIWTDLQSINAGSLGVVPTSRQVIAGAGMSGGGPLSADVTLTLALTSPIISAAGGVVTSGSYANPAWITSIAASKLTGAPPAATIAASQTPWLQDIDGATFTLKNVGKVGIGTASPQALLDIFGPTGYMIRTGVSGKAYGIGIDASLNLGVDDINAPARRFTISATGNVGIGTTNPPSVLSVVNPAAGIAGGNEVLRIGTVLGANIGGGPYITFSDSTLTNVYGCIKCLNPSAGDTDFVFMPFSGSEVIERMRITGSGNVGIGTTSAGYLLDLRGGSSNSQLHISTDATDTGGWLYSGGAAQMQMSGGAVNLSGSWTAKGTSASLISCAGGQVFFYADTGLTAGNIYTPTQRMAISYTGNVGIGTASPQAFLEVSNLGTLTQTPPANLMLSVSGKSGAAQSDSIPMGRLQIALSSSYDHGAYIGSMYYMTGEAGAVFGSRYLATDYPMIFLKQSKVGIGTASPAYETHISTTGVAYSGTPSLTPGSTPGQFGIDNGSNNAELVFGWLGAAPYGYWMQCRGGGVARPISLNPIGGNVGIGTNNPGATLTVNGPCVYVASPSNIDATLSATGAMYAYAPSNTQLVFRMRGSDGTWRQATLTLA